MKSLLEAMEVHDTLNPKIWNKDFTIRTEVREKILEIVKQFKEFCDIDFNILDVELVGSGANYNWTVDSDIDIHIVVDFETVDSSDKLVSPFFKLEKSAFNKKYDITIHELEVEVYVQDVNESLQSNGIYSVINEQWIKKPVKLDNVEQFDNSKILKKWETKIKNSNDIDELKTLLNSIHLVRRNSLQIDGEYGRGNQLFKEMRHSGLLKELRDKITELQSKELSL